MSIEKEGRRKFFESAYRMKLTTGFYVLLFGLTTILTFCKAKQVDIDGFQRGCKLEGLHPLLIVTYKNITISVDKITVPHGERVTVRCRELGKYKLIGDSLLHCRNASWNGKLPSCTPTTAISNYTGETEDVPPTIVFGLPAGSAAVEPSGVLAVFPGSILHLECLFARKLGNPEWTWTSTFRQYLTGWAIAARERDWKYRLSIYYAKAQDSGVYTCSTPRGLSNSIRVHVVDVQCPVLNLPEPLIGKIEGARMGHGAAFECPAGFKLKGAAGITCQYNGKWSAEMPECITITCPSVEILDDTRLQLLEYNNTFGSRAIFTCMWGHKLLGPQSIECQGDGSWSGDKPSCVEITCPIPLIPKSGRIMEQTNRHNSGRKQHQTRVYKVGALVRFVCLPGHQLLGEASIICTENGTWSHPSPVCKVRCPYPGDPPHGRIAPLKFWYKPGDNIQVTCSPGYVTPLEPVRKPTCRENGIWSAPPPPCRSYKDV
ncbi:locomotion-related protein Hikaru genki isoform X3 [Apis cerana]|uniref:locomotion-related protein Hikaru genki isoform X3 n=1 Tax=Apis cerana TaxID=7461 RepID=UPI002B22A72C|nr:locomotion-related protein Hikaru genki isoform X3 [Apis cerana]XP_061926908.1 locomotion-related protein Hikaru genki isoform X3 [Apis cerana]